MKINTRKLIAFLSFFVLVFSHTPAFSQTSLIYDVRVDDVTSTSAKVLWATSEPVDTAAVHFDVVPGDHTNTSYDICSGYSGEFVAEHCIELNNLMSGTAYYYVAEVLAGAGTLVQSSEHEFATLEKSGEETGSDDVAPEAPSDLSATVSSENEILLSWHDTSGNEEKFEIYYISPEFNNYEFLAVVGKNTTEFLHESINSGTYEYRVRACSSEQCSSFSSPVTATVEDVIGDEEDTTSNMDDETIAQDDLFIKGTVYIENTVVDSAFVWAKSESGAYHELETETDGTFSIPSDPGQTWHMGAGKKIDGVAYRSEGVTVTVGQISYILDIFLERYKEINEEESHTTNTSQETAITTEEDVEIKAPANFTTTSDSVTFTVEPDIKTPETDTSRKVVGTAYELRAKDSSGNLITQFQTEVTITLPYREGDIAAAGGTEDTISVHFWNESSSEWEELEGSVADKANNKISANTTHFTRFAVLTAVQQEDLSGITDGDLIKTANNPDVYIAKFVGNKKYKRLILNPDIFNSYGHLSWDNIKIVTQSQLDAFFLSELTMEVYADGTAVNGKVYRVSSSPNSDVGVSYRLDITPQQFEKKGFDWEAIFKINHFEASPDFYPAGSPITA